MATEHQRHAMVIGLKPEKMDEYIKLHAETWPEILKLIKRCNIHNYSIHLGELEKGRYYLFGYFEYHGDSLQEDMKVMAENEDMKRWWKFTDPCQIPCPTRKDKEFWMMMNEVFSDNSISG